MLASGNCSNSLNNISGRDIWNSKSLAYAVLTAIAYSYRDVTECLNDSKFADQTTAFKAIVEVQAGQPAVYDFDDVIKEPLDQSQSLLHVCSSIISTLDNSNGAQLYENFPDELVRRGTRSNPSFKMVEKAGIPLTEESVRLANYKLTAIILRDDKDEYSVALLKYDKCQRRTQTRRQAFNMKEYLNSPSSQTILKPVLICYSLIYSLAIVSMNDFIQSVGPPFGEPFKYVGTTLPVKKGRAPEEWKEWCERIEKNLNDLKQSIKQKQNSELDMNLTELRLLSANGDCTPEALSATDASYSAMTLKWKNVSSEFDNLCKEFENQAKHNNRDENALVLFCSSIFRFRTRLDLQL